MKTIWDVPTRAMHWGIVASFATAWLTAENEGLFLVHLGAGFSLGALLIARLVWGFLGAPASRFANWPFFRVGEYVAAVRAGKPIRWPGHGPLAAWWSALALLLMLAVPPTGVFVWSQEGFALGEDEASEHERGESEEDEAREHGGGGAHEEHEEGEHFAKELHEIPVNLMLLMILVHLVGIAKESFLTKEPVALGMINGGKAE